MKFYDISMELNERTVVWKDDAPPQLVPVCRTPAQPCNFTWLNFSAHAGTHVDAPYYLFADRWTADQIPLERLIGRCQVLDLTAVRGTISAADLAAQHVNAQKLLLKTANSLDALQSYNPQHVDLDRSAGEWLIAQGVTTLGFDYQSFERNGSSELHRLFLEKNITLVDNLRLGHVPAGNYELLCLPVKVTGIDAAPARAILMEEALCAAN